MRFFSICWKNLSLNPITTLDFINNNLDKPWDWSQLTYNPIMTLDFITNNLDKPWNWFFIDEIFI